MRLARAPGRRYLLKRGGDEPQLKLVLYPATEPFLDPPAPRSIADTSGTVPLEETAWQLNLPLYYTMPRAQPGEYLFCRGFARALPADSFCVEIVLSEPG